MRTIVGITGASGVAYGVDFLRRCPDEKYLVASKWGKRVLHEELGLKVEELRPWVTDIYSDSVSTLAKIANGIADTLITRIAAVALKEKRRLIIALRETPLGTIALENALKLSREGVVIAPISPTDYMGAESISDVVSGYVDKLLGLVGVDTGRGWRRARWD